METLEIKFSRWVRQRGKHIYFGILRVEIVRNWYRWNRSTFWSIQAGVLGELQLYGNRCVPYPGAQS